jgi:hypothetical protein
MINRIINLLRVRIEKLKPVNYNLELYEKLYILNDLRNKRFYNIGAGNFRHPYWTNIDYHSDWYKTNPIDINIDLLNFVQFPIQ